jgi:hypothetical protein
MFTIGVLIKSGDWSAGVIGAASKAGLIEYKSREIRIKISLGHGHSRIEAYFCTISG